MKVLSYIISPEFVYMWIRVATPIIFSSLGGVICSRAGVVNLGLEGIMLISALAGVLGSAFGGSLLWGVVAGLAAALAVSALFAYFHLVLKANNVLCGTAVNTMASGLTVFVLQLATGEKGNSSSLKSFAFPQVNIPVIKDIPVLGSIISGHNALTYFALLMVFVIWFFLYKTPMGLRMRAVGENPDAASSVGQNVTGIRFLAILLCGVQVPLVIMGYLNPIMRFGFEAFCQACSECGIDGMIIPDLPFRNYLEEYKLVADRYDLKIIMLITPATEEERIRLIDQHTDGFIYMVSSAAITGAQKAFGNPLQEYFNRVNSGRYSAGDGELVIKDVCIGGNRHCRRVSRIC